MLNLSERFFPLTVSQLEHEPDTRFLGLQFENLSLEETATLLAQRKAEDPFQYVVTPNTQHVVVGSQNPLAQTAFQKANYTLCDSKVLVLLAKVFGISLSHVTGSDLTVHLFKHHIKAGDDIAVVCSSEELAGQLRATYPKIDWHFFIPPLGTEIGSAECSACIDFLLHSKARFKFVALGAPKSEIMCLKVSEMAGATGTTLNVGAALSFLVGNTKRAPKFMQRVGLEWAFRLMSEPRRLAGRYVSIVFPLIGLLFKQALKRS